MVITYGLIPKFISENLTKTKRAVHNGSLDQHGYPPSLTGWGRVRQSLGLRK